ncbi:MAG TPA: hypothetical protein VGF69_07155 [Thermoanaerobaculia bacterium]|jgi:hypothetical protein
MTSKQPGAGGLDRRDFLVLGSAAAVGAAASGLSAGPIQAVVAPATGAILSVGYSDDGAHLHSASRLRTTDSRFREEGVELTVHGLWQPRSRAALAALNVSAFSPHIGEDGPVPFLAWTYRRGNQSGRVTFRAALDDNGTLPLAIERVERPSSVRRVRRLMSSISLAPVKRNFPRLTDEEQSGNVCRLTSGSTGDACLRPGTYFVALRRSWWDSAPQWNLVSPEERSLQLLQSGRPVDFEYVALTVAYPKA